MHWDLEPTNEAAEAGSGWIDLPARKAGETPALRRFMDNAKRQLSSSRSFVARRLGSVLALTFLFFSGLSLRAQVPFADVSAVNLTPSSFSVVWATSPGATPSISVFSDSGGASNLAGQVGLELYPFNTGNPALTNAYDRRANFASLRRQMTSLGLAQVRVSGCLPGATYYYRLQVSDTNGQQTLWPATGPLPSVTTPAENAFVAQSRQLVITLPDTAPLGSIVILANSNTPSLLAAVAGDGVATNQVYLNVNDLLALTGNTNYLPVGNLEFTTTILEGASATAAQTYSLNFTTDFLVGQESQYGPGGGSPLLTFGSTILRSGSSGSIPIWLEARGVTNLAFTLTLPANLLNNLSLKPLAPQLASASLQIMALNEPLPTPLTVPNHTTAPPNTFLAAFATALGQPLQGALQIAQLNFTAVSNQSSTFVPISPESLSGANSDGSELPSFAVQPGRVAILGPEPMIEALPAPGGGRNLVLYGIPGASYEIQYSTALPNPGTWVNFLRVPMTNFVETFSGLETSQFAEFYRAYQFTANPPLLESYLANHSPTLMLYGVPGANYQLQYTTNLSGIVTWYPLLSYALSNAFTTITNFSASYPTIFYRTKKR